MEILTLIVIAYIIIAVLFNRFLQKRKDSKIDFEEFAKFETEAQSKIEMSDNESDDNEELEDIREEVEFEDSKAKISIENALLLAKDAETKLQYEYILAQNSSSIVQLEIARKRTFEAQCVLLECPNLCGEALLEICEHSKKFNFDNSTVEKWFSEAIQHTKLTAIQEIRISQCGEFIMKKALLLRENLTAAGLVELCENSGSLNLENSLVESWYSNKINKIPITEKQQLKIARTKKFTMHKILLLSPKLKGETLVEISQNPGKLNLENTTVWEWFEDAVERIPLTSRQQTQMAETNNFAAQRAILISSKIDYAAFLVICQNTRRFNMKNDTVQKYFEDATRRLLPNLTDEQKVKLAQTKIDGVIKGLM